MSNHDPIERPEGYNRDECVKTPRDSDTLEVELLAEERQEKADYLKRYLKDALAARRVARGKIEVAENSSHPPSAPPN